MSDIVTGDLLNAHRGMTGIIADLSRFLAVRLRQSEEIITKQQSFHENVQAFQAQLVMDLQAVRLESNTVFSRALEKVEETIQAATQKVLGPVSKAKEEIDKLTTVGPRSISDISANHDSSGIQ